MSKEKPDTIDTAAEITETQQQQINEILEEAPVDISQPEVSYNAQPHVSSGNIGVIQCEVVKTLPFNANRQPVNTQYEFLRDGTQYILTYREKIEFECPSCGYVPQHSNEVYLEHGEKPPELEGRCQDCGVMTCTRCYNECHCGHSLCSGCADGFGMDSGTLCYRHRRDVQDEIELEKAMELRKMQGKEEAMHRHTDMIRQVKFRELELEEKIKDRRLDLIESVQEHQKRIDKLKLWMQHEQNIRQHELKKVQMKLQQELDRRKQNLKEFKAAAEQYLEREKLALDRERMERDDDFRHKQLDQSHEQWEREQEFKEESWEAEHEWEKDQFNAEQEFKWKQHDDQMDLAHRKQDAKEKKDWLEEKIRAEKHEIQKINSLLNAGNKLDFSSQRDRRSFENNLEKALKKMSSNKQDWMPKQITV